MSTSGSRWTGGAAEMGCGSSTQVKQGAPPAEVHPDDYERESSSGEEESSSGSYDSYESDAASEPDEMPEPEPQAPADEDEVRAQEVVKPLSVAVTLAGVVSPTGSFKVRKTRQRRTSVELFKARDAEATNGGTPRAAARVDQVARLAEDGPDLDEGVAGLVNGWLQACVVGDVGKLWGLLAPQMQEQLTDEAAALSHPCPTPQEHCVAKNGWDWPESRGKFVKMRVSSFDGHMCGIRSSFDTGLLTVDYRDVVWVRDGRITATKSIQMLTHEVRRKLAADLVDHAASGREEKVWLALAPSMRARYEKSVEKRRLTAEEGCLQEHSWQARRGEFEGQKLVTYDEATGTAVIHAYFRQGGIDQVAYKELFSVSSGMITDRKTEFMATDWQKKQAATKLVEAIVAENSQLVWRGLSLQLQEKYTERGAKKKSGALTGVEYCMFLHRWRANRGHCTSVEVQSFEGKSVTIATTFNTHGSPNLAYRDTFFLVTGSALALSHTSDCVWTVEQAWALIEDIVAAAALNELPLMYSHIEGALPFTSPRLRVDPTRGGRWIYTICNERLQGEIADQAEQNGFPSLGGQTEGPVLDWCCRRFDWAGRTQALGCTIAGFRGFEIVGCDRTPGRADAYTAQIRTLFDVGVTHTAVLVDELTVCAGMLDMHRRCTEHYEMSPRFPLPHPAELALVTGATHKLGFDVAVEEVECDHDGHESMGWKTSLESVKTVVEFMETVGRGDLHKAYTLLSPKCQDAYGESKHADAAKAVKKKEQADGRAAEARLVAMEARGGGFDSYERDVAKLREAVEAEKRQAASTDGVSEVAFQLAVAWRGPRLLEVGTKFEHVMRLHENGKRGSDMGKVTVVDFDSVNRTARVHCKWEPTNAVYEDTVTVCQHTGKIASFTPLGIATQEDVEAGQAVEDSLAFILRWLVFAPRLPHAEEGVMSQASTAVSLSLEKTVEPASVGYEPITKVERWTDKDGVQVHHEVNALQKFSGAYLHREGLKHLTVHHDVTLQKLQLVMRDSVPIDFDTIAGGVPQLTPEERNSCLTDTMFSFDDIRTFLDDAQAWRAHGEPDFGYAVRLRAVLCDVLLKNTVQCVLLAKKHLQHCFHAPQIKKLFVELDADGSGFLNVEEVKQLAVKLGGGIADEDLSAAMAEMDPSGDGKVDPQEFSGWWRRANGEGTDGIHHMACCELYVTALRLNDVPTRLLVCMAKPPVAERQLPPGWEVKIGPDTGDEFFRHATTGQTTCERPDGGERMWHLLEQRRFTASMFIEGVGWVTADVLNPDPSSFGLGLADAVVWSVLPALSSMRSDMALLRPGFEAGAACEHLFQEYDVDGSGTLSSSEVGELLAEITGMPRVATDHIKHAIKLLDRSGDGMVSRDELLDAVLEEGPFGKQQAIPTPTWVPRGVSDGLLVFLGHMLAGLSTHDMPLGVRSSLNRVQASIHVEVSASLAAETIEASGDHQRTVLGERVKKTSVAHPHVVVKLGRIVDSSRKAAPVVSAAAS